MPARDCGRKYDPALHRMNLPNKLTISRFILTVAFLAVMFSRRANRAPKQAHHQFWNIDGPTGRQDYGLLGVHRLCRSRLDSRLDGRDYRGPRIGHYRLAAPGG